MKKSVFIFILFLAFFSFVSAGDAFGITDKLEEGAEKVEEAKDKIEGLKDTDTSYLVGEWARMIRNNPVAGTVEKGFNFLSPVFKILIQESYSFSWKFFILLIIWIFVFFNLSDLLSKSLFEGWLGWAIGLVVTTILAFVGFFQTIYSYFLGFITMFEGWKKWIIIGTFVLAILLLGKFRGYFTEYLEEQKKKEAKDREKFNRWLLNKIVSVFKKDIERY